MDGWAKAEIKRRVRWDVGLSTFQLDAIRSFEPGQFIKLGLALPQGFVSRAYSIASAPAHPLEFFVVRVDGGVLSPHLDALALGDAVFVAPKISGHFTLSSIPKDGARVLWAISTGTGLAPTVSMLRDATVWARFDRVIVVHGARTVAQLAYAEELTEMTTRRPLTVLRATTRDGAPGVLHGRLPDLLDDGTLEWRADDAISAERCHVTLCGNPEMIKAMRERLQLRGLATATPTRPGNVHVERYW
jgi:ferredoxin--NADP+ reductase